MARTVFPVEYTILCTPPKSWTITFYRCCPPGAPIPVAGLDVTLTSLASGTGYERTTDDSGHITVPIEDGPYSVAWPARECCKAGSIPHYACTEYVGPTGYPCSPCKDITYGAIASSIRDDLVCCDHIGPVPKVLKLMDTLGGCDLVSLGGCMWVGCSSGLRQNVNDLKHHRETKARVALTGDQSCIVNLCPGQETYTGYLSSWREIKQGHTACAYNLTTVMGFDGRPQFILSANWIDDPGEIIDYALLSIPWWCAKCHSDYPVPHDEWRTFPGAYNPCTDYPVDGSINFWRDEHGLCKSDCTVDPTRCYHGYGVSQGYKAATCADVHPSMLGAKGVGVLSVDPWLSSCADPTLDLAITLLPGKNTAGQQLVYGFESPKTNDIPGLFYPLLSEPPGGQTVLIFTSNVEH